MYAIRPAYKTQTCRSGTSRARHHTGASRDTASGDSNDLRTVGGTGSRASILVDAAAIDHIRRRAERCKRTKNKEVNRRRSC